MDCQELRAVLSIDAHPAVCQLGADVLRQLVLCQVAAVVDLVEVVGCVVVVEADGVLCGASPGTRPCPGGSATSHVEVQVGLSCVRVEIRIMMKVKDRINVRCKVIKRATYIFAASQAVLLVGAELCLPFDVVERAIVVETSRGAGQSGVVVESNGEPPFLATAACAARAVERLHRDHGQAGEAWGQAMYRTADLLLLCCSYNPSCEDFC